MTFANTTSEQANKIADDHFSGNQRRIVKVYGGVGLGKSSLLGALKLVLRDRGKIPILVSPTFAEVDTAAEAIVQIFDGLDSYGILGDEREKVKDPSRPFQDKVDVALRIISEHADTVVLLCDEPDEWAIRSKRDQLFYVRDNKHSRSLSYQVRNDFECAKVLAERYLEGEPEYAPIYLRPASSVASSGEITDFADELGFLLSHNSGLKEQRSFFHLRLLAALRAAGDDSGNLVWANDNLLAGYFVKFLKAQQLLDNLLKLAASLALVRGEISEDLLEHLGINQGLSDLEQRLIRHGLLSTAGAGVYTTHPLLKSAISGAGLLTPKATMLAHARIAQFHESHLNALRDRNQAALLVEYHGYDQNARAGFASIERVSHFFVSQLHVWGRCLSRDLKLHEQAAKVFNIAISEDPLDDYGHHYKAYNLDYIAKNEDASEIHYRKAIEFNARHPWYWSRWINFLITTGRMKEARQEWTFAGNALSSPDNCDDETFSNLHFWVAQLLVHRAQLDFASQILDEVPGRIRQTEAQFVELDQLLESLKIARDERAVFPAYIDPQDYWSEYPHLRQPIQWKGRSLTEFNSARIERWHDDTVDLVVGKRENEEVRYGLFTFTHDEIRQALGDAVWHRREEIQFVELCFYGEDNAMRMDAYPTERPFESAMPRLDPPNPNRYLEGWNPRA